MNAAAWRLPAAVAAAFVMLTATLGVYMGSMELGLLVAVVFAGSMGTGSVVAQRRWVQVTLGLAIFLTICGVLVGLAVAWASVFLDFPTD